MKLLILGRHGQIATHLRELAPDALCWGRDTLDLTGTPETIEQRILEARPQAIINAAAYTAVDRAETESAQAWAINATAVVAIAQAAERLAVPLVHFSTDYVFDGRSTVPYTPDDPVCPLGIYGATKLAGELAVTSLCRSAWVLRTSWVFSEHGSNFVKTMLRLGAERATLSVVADQHGRPSHAGGLAAIALRLAEQAASGSLPAPPGCYHLGAGPATTWHAFAGEIFARARALGLLERTP
ncbi:MAG: dTDP-4-dehydrorhamnose reductase, partial [Gammaproteobacteria bacterium]|nr:dTDP-4-dehydrorhamnose reductase [Gammaproteobacteria bacterium]